ncbi:nucleotidyltransferase family protein [Anaeroselena agilis]|uniref:tRNA(Met) cytidine acetate ligase n=1 Tax=Anaeroselena agilis TaxID=3063788 RepID=A0ABU3NY88_9FIRM|nr:nucleotidyltransferase family protein [Selenomonadales bacterium 4137-cl]
MRAVGIVAEYNPFHNGHRYHVEETRRLYGDAPIVAAMSGNFMQRGEPALFDKWTRAEMAVRGGVDLVLELPVAFAVRSAQFFAAGAVRFLYSLGVVDWLSFGAEHPELGALKLLAAAVDDETVRAVMRSRLDAGETYAAALGKSLAAASGLPPAMVASPNNILAVEYLRAIEKFAPYMVPCPVARQGAHYHEKVVAGAIASATAIRGALLGGRTLEAFGAMPPSARELAERCMAEGRGPVSWGGLTVVLLAALRRAAVAELAELPDVTEGLEYKMKAAGAAGGLEGSLAVLKSKRYSLTRLQRVLVHALLMTDRRTVAGWDECGPLYARVLAFSGRGRELLRAMAKTAAVPVVTKTTHFLHSRDLDGRELTPLQAMLALDALATDVYSLGMPNPEWRRGGRDFRQSPLYVACRPVGS